MYKAIKTLTKTGAITLTKDIRYLTGLRPADAVDVTVTEDGNAVIIRKHIPSCFFCGSPENIKAFRGYNVCEKCREEMLKNDHQK